MVTLVTVPRYVALLKNYASKPMLTNWLKNEGEMVEEGQTVAVVETTKAVLEISAETSGMLFPLRKIGEKVAIGDTIGVIAKDNASFDEYKESLAQEAVSA